MTGQTVPVYRDGVECGRLHIERQGLRTVFRTNLSLSGLYKLRLRGEEGDYLLGTPVPEGACLTLERTVSNALLREKGVERATWAELEGAETRPQSGQWQPVDRLELPGMEEELRRGIRRIPGGVWRREGRYIRVCCPWQVGQRMPCMPLFCFASYAGKKGGTLSWFLDEMGNPCIKPDGAGENRG